MATSRVVFSLRKYSWSTDEHSNGKSQYQHLIAQDLSLLLEGRQEQHGPLRLQIIRGTTILEDIDLGKHIDIATSTRETFRRTGREVADKQLPTYGVTDGIKLAITHRPDSGGIHKLQIALTKADECDSVITFLKYRGMAFVDAQKHSARPSTTDSDIRSVKTTSSAFANHDKKQIISVSQPRTRSQHKSTILPISTAALRSFDAANRASPASTSSDLFLVRDENTAPRTLELDHPTASQIFARAMPTQTKSGIGTRSDPVIAGISSSSSPFTPSTSFFKDHNISRLSTTSWPPPRSIEDLLPPPREIPSELTRRERSRSSSVLSLTALPKPQLKTSTSEGPPHTDTSYNTRPQFDTPLSEAGSDRITRSKRQLEYAQSSDHMLPPTSALSDRNRSSPRDMDEFLHGKRPRLEEQANAGQPLISNKTEISTAISENIDLEHYTKLGPSERSKLLEKFIMDMLGNKDFKMLCEDIAGCWQKFAL